MDVDLSYKSINELNFDAESSSPEELSAAACVVKLTASHNCISRIVGLGALFHQLTHLDLSHNKLGCSGAHRSESTSRVGGGSRPSTPWLSLLPRALRVLNLSHNHLRGFSLEEDLGNINGGSMNTASTESTTLEINAALSGLRNYCPVMLALFFNRRLFPHLSELDLSSNELQQTLEESDIIEGMWQESVEIPTNCGAGGGGAKAAWVQCATSAVVVLRLDGNRKLESLNGVLCGMEGLLFLHAVECGVADLTGLSSAATACPKLRGIDLRGSPLTETFLGAPDKVVATFTEILLFPVLLASRGGGVCKGERERSEEEETRYALQHLVKEIVQRHLVQMEASIQRQQSSSDDGNGKRREGGLRLVIYVSLLHQVLPQLIEIDDDIEVDQTERMFTEAARDVLQHYIECNDRPHGNCSRQASPKRCVSPPQTFSPVEEVDGSLQCHTASQFGECGSSLREPAKRPSRMRERPASLTDANAPCSPLTIAGSGHPYLTSPPVPLSPSKSPTDECHLLRGSRLNGSADYHRSEALAAGDKASMTPYKASVVPSRALKSPALVSDGVVSTAHPRDDDKSGSNVCSGGARRGNRIGKQDTVTDIGASKGAKCRDDTERAVTGVADGVTGATHKNSRSQAFNASSSASATGPPLAPPKDVASGSAADDSRSSNRYQMAVSALTPMLEQRLRSSSLSDSLSTVNDRSRQSNDTHGGRSIDSSHQHCTNNFSSAASTSTFTTVSSSTRDRLLQQARTLELSLVSSQDRQRGLHDSVTQLRAQLRQDRQLIKEQRQEALRLREERDRLVGVIKDAKQRLERRQKDVAYGAAALKRREVLEQQKAVMQRLAREKRRLQEQEKRLRESMSLSGLGLDSQVSAPFSRGVSPEGRRCRQPLHLRKTRSDLLRENAVRVRMEAVEKEEPLAYNLRRFRRNELSTNEGKEDTLVNSVTRTSSLREANHHSSLATDNSKIRETVVEGREGTKMLNGRDPSPLEASCRRARGDMQNSFQIESFYQQGCDPYAEEGHNDGAAPASNVHSEWVDDMSLQSLFDAAVDVQRRLRLVKQLERRKNYEMFGTCCEEMGDDSDLITTMGESGAQQRSVPAKLADKPALYHAAVDSLYDERNAKLSFSDGCRESNTSGDCSIGNMIASKGEVGTCDAVYSADTSQHPDTGEVQDGGGALSRPTPPQNINSFVSSVSSRDGTPSAAGHLSIDARSIYAEIIKQQQQYLQQCTEGHQSMECAAPANAGFIPSGTSVSVDGVLWDYRARSVSSQATERGVAEPENNDGSKEYDVPDASQRTVFI